MAYGQSITKMLSYWGVCSELCSTFSTGMGKFPFHCLFSVSRIDISLSFFLSIDHHLDFHPLLLSGCITSAVITGIVIITEAFGSLSPPFLWFSSKLTFIFNTSLAYSIIQTSVYLRLGSHQTFPQNCFFFVYFTSTNQILLLCFFVDWLFFKFTSWIDIFQYIYM